MKVRCIHATGLLTQEAEYEVIAEGSSAYTVALPDGRHGYYSKFRFVPAHLCACMNEDCVGLCMARDPNHTGG